MHAIIRSLKRFALFSNGRGKSCPYNSRVHFPEKLIIGRIDTGMIDLTRVNILPVKSPPDRLVLPARELVDFNSEEKLLFVGGMTSSLSDTMH